MDNTPGFRRWCLIVQHHEMAHRQHVPFGRVLNVPRDSIPADQPERAFLFPLLLQGFPKLRSLRFKAGLSKVIDPAADDLLPRKPQELAVPKNSGARKMRILASSASSKARAAPALLEALLAK